MPQQQDRDFSNFLPGCTPALAGSTNSLSHRAVSRKTCTLIVFPLISSWYIQTVSTSSVGMQRTWLRMWTTPWWRWSEPSFRWTNWRPWGGWPGWERRSATCRTSGADGGRADNGLLQHAELFFFFFPSFFFFFYNLQKKKKRISMLSCNL